MLHRVLPVIQKWATDAESEELREGPHDMQTDKLLRAPCLLGPLF